MISPAEQLTWYGTPYKFHTWTANELAMVRKMYPHHPSRDIAEAINAITKHTVKVTASGVHYQAKRMGLLKSPAFRKEHPSVTRNQYGRGKAHESQHVPGVPYRTRKPDKDGYVWFVIDPATGRRKPAHRWLVEQKQSLKRTDVVTFATGDKTDLSSVVVVPRGHVQHMAAARMRTKQPEARRKAWETRRKKAAAIAYASHKPYTFDRQ